MLTIRMPLDSDGQGQEYLINVARRFLNAIGASHTDSDGTLTVDVDKANASLDLLRELAAFYELHMESPLIRNLGNFKTADGLDGVYVMLPATCRKMFISPRTTPPEPTIR